MRSIIIQCKWRQTALGLALLSALLCGVPAISKAGPGQPPVLQVLNGSQGQLAKDSFTIVSDTLFFDHAFDTVLVKPYLVRNTITFRIDPYSPYALQGNFTATIRLALTVTAANGDTSTIDTSLTVRYNKDSLVLDQDRYLFSNAYTVKVKVLDRSTDAGWDVWKVLQLENELQSFPQYIFTCASDTIQSVTHGSLDSAAKADELPVNWTTVVGADQYDIEWTYIDSSALAKSLYGNPASPDPSLIFDNNSSRVTVAGLTYNIPLFYDGAGTLFFRVRPVQLQAGGGRTEGHWSSDHRAAGSFYFKGHQRNLNWQSTTSYAEEGKRKSVLQYYDGSLRGRQTVTKDNTTNTTIVSESFYDFQGRPVIQVLPAPTFGNVIKYSQNFNLGLNGAYDKSDFDTLPDPSLYCSTGANAMPTDSGASLYYSPTNPEKDSGINKYIPDAHGYPFTEVEYVQDNTGRISRQSGVGINHRLGSGHETKYFYGTPDQHELDALFGTEVGDHNHYFKTMVRDANGQYSVSYTDMHGRTVATALAGLPPDSVKLDTLSSYVSQTITETLSDPASNVINDLTMESKKGLLVAVAGNYVFHYKLDPAALSLADCNSTPVCYDCLYDLEITMTDDCNNRNFGGHAFDTVVHNYHLPGPFNISCGTSPDSFTVNFTKFLGEGSYEVTKRLTVSRYGESYYRDSVYMTKNGCRTFNTILAAQQAIQASNTQCQPTCQSSTDSLGSWSDFYRRYIAHAGIDSTDSSYKSLILSAYQQAQADCRALCDSTNEEDDVQQAMLMDMTAASGQYANPDSASDPYSIFNLKFTGTTGDSLANYQLPTNYVDENGQPDTVYDETTGAMLLPQNLSPEVFAQKFKQSWAQALLPYHPEYCKLVQYQAIPQSPAWDKRFESVDTYSAALQKGYLNPTDNGSTPYSRYTGTPTTDYDPLATVYSNGTNHYKDSLEWHLIHYMPAALTLGGSGYLTLWQFATATVRCANKPTSCMLAYRSNDDSAFSTNTCQGDLDMAWRTFRQAYLDIKRGQINRVLKVACAAPITDSLLAAHHQPHFSDAGELAQITGIIPPLDSNTAKAQSQAAAANYYDATCRAYVTMWWQDLKSCNYSSVDSAVIIPRLIQVCKEGSDGNHPYGASSVAPISGYRYRSFEDVITQYNDSANKSLTTCNAYSIEAPAPYDQQVVYSQKPIWTRPGDCECTQITSRYADYQATIGHYTSFSDYLSKAYQTTISDSVLTVLLNLCNSNPATATCNYFTAPIQLPPVLQCSAGNVCVGCTQFMALDSEFRSRYPGIDPVAAPNPFDSLQLSYNNLFVNFMNFRLGFTKSVADYLSFRGTCQAGVVSGNNDCNAALQFDGFTTRKRIRIPLQNDRLRITTGDFTFEATVKPKPTALQNVILTNRTNAPGGGLADGFEFLFNDSSVLLQVEGCPNYFSSNNHGINPFDGKAHHVAAVRTSDSVFLYLDGVKLDVINGSCTGSGTSLADRDISTTGDYYIGLDSVQTPSGLQGAFDGWISEVRIWNVARTPSQIAANLNTRLSPQAGLVGYYILSSADTCRQIIPDLSTTDPLQQNYAFRGRLTGSDIVDPIWLSGSQISFNSADPTGVSNTCGCSANYQPPVDTCARFTYVNSFSAGTGDTAVDLVQTADGGHLVAGRFNNGGNLDAFVAKTDRKGVVQWHKSYGGSSADNFVRIRNTSDGGFVALGNTASAVSGKNLPWVVKGDGSGNVQWSRTLDAGSTNGEVATDIIQTSDSGYAIAANYDFVATSADWEIIRLNASGGTVWSKQFGTNSSDNAGGLLQDGNYLVFSGLAIGDQMGGASDMYDGVLLKLVDSSGALVWSKSYDLPGHHWWLGDIQPRITGGYIVNGVITNEFDFPFDSIRHTVLTVDTSGGSPFATLFHAPGESAGQVKFIEDFDGRLISVEGEFSGNADIYIQEQASFHSIFQTIHVHRLVQAGDQRIGGLIRNADSTYEMAGYSDSSALLIRMDRFMQQICHDSTHTDSTESPSVTEYTSTLAKNNTLSVTNASYSFTPGLQEVSTADFCNSSQCRVAVTDSLFLCGRSEPVLAPVAANSTTNCSDSSFFSASKATEFFKAYTDSLQGNFDSTYRSKCMQAYLFEQFTVTHAESEYHHTLYYYDQAGNLLKTVPPAGVHEDYDSTWLAGVAAARAAGSSVVPSHGLLTQYRYNTLNQVMAQQTPDAGQSHFWYDRLGRLVISRNARQKAASSGEAGSQYSYTLYDSIGRITEVGQISNAGSSPMTDSISRSESNLLAWLAASASNKEQITQTIYDVAYGGFTGISFTPIVQRNLRNRVAFTTFSLGSNPAQYNQGTFYTYDIEGNVDTLLQDYGNSSFAANVMNKNGNRFKRMVYDYDLVSGKVNSVAYQPHQVDAFYHRYTYDAENRLIVAETSQDSVYWDKEARYEYYKHGPLARVVIGDKLVQGLDYAYTLQGWLKGVNSSSLLPVYDMGRDGDTTAQNRYVAKDEYGFGLNYFAGDYSAIGTGITPFPGTSAFLNTSYRPLFNGNISSMAVNIGKLYMSDSSHWRGPMLYNYRYDQLNRITGMDAFYGLNQAGNSWSGLMPTVDFRERVAYDGNGNILKYKRNNFGETGLPMDSLGYGYLAGTNKLVQIKDSASDAIGGGYDLHSQPNNNYAYDSIGNLVKDSIEHISSIKWNVYGKITEIDHSTTTTSHPTKNIYYYYDAAGNRIGKKTTRGDSTAASYTWYVRDASGNVMATYAASLDTAKVLDSADVHIGEKHIYGSSRLGIVTANYSTDANTDGLNAYTSPWIGAHLPYYTGKKQYELTNHLGNVLATITDKKIGISLTTDSSLIDHYEADVMTAQDYYPFGMIMPGRMYISLQVPGGSVTGTTQVNGYTVPVDLTLNSRTGDKPSEYVATQFIDLVEGFESGDSTDVLTAYLADTSYAGTGNGGSAADGVAGQGKYRYGFNGKEKDDEVKGVGDQIDYGMRVYDPRAGRFLSIDPITKNYPSLTPFQFASNTPIHAFDLDGLEKVPSNFGSPDRVNSLFGFDKNLFASQSTNKAIQSNQPSIRQLNELSMRNILIVQNVMCHPENTLLLRARAEIEAEYAKLDHAHGQVELPRNKIVNYLFGARTFTGKAGDGNFYLNRVVDANGYITDKTQPTTGTPPGIAFRGVPELRGILQESDYISLYRNLGKNEMTSLLNGNLRFSLQEGGNIGKDFWLTEEGLKAWNTTKFSKAFNVEIQVDRKFLESISKESFFTDNLPGGAHNAVSLDKKDLDMLNDFIKSIKLSKK